MIIDEAFLEGLLEKAAESGRRRANYDLRTSGEDRSQRMLNALLPGTRVPVHRHSGTTETVVVLSGRLTEVFFDEDGVETERYDLCPAEGRFALQIPKGMWHTVLVSEPCIIFESKDGAYEPQRPEDVMPDEVVQRARLKQLKARISQFIEEEARSQSMEIITPEYVYRMWGGKVELEEIRMAMAAD